MRYEMITDLPGLRLGHQGELVKVLQRLVGADDDGYYGPMTVKAVMARQDAMGFPVTGEASVQFLIALAGGPVIEKPVEAEKLAVPVETFPVIDIVEDLPRGNVPTKDLSRQVGIILHHSYTHSSLAGSSPQGYAGFHTGTQGWPCIAYHMVIQVKEGKIYRTLNLGDKGYHAGDKNGTYYGICISGNYDEEVPTDRHYDMILAAIQELTASHEFATRQSWSPMVRPHSDFSQKTCPGTKIDMDRVRRMVAGK